MGHAPLAGRHHAVATVRSACNGELSLARPGPHRLHQRISPQYHAEWRSDFQRHQLLLLRTMKTKLSLAIFFISACIFGADFDPFHKEFGISVGPLGRFIGNGGGMTNLNGGVNWDGVTMTNTIWYDQLGNPVMLIDGNGAFLMIDTNLVERFKLDPITDVTSISDHDGVSKVLITGTTLFLHDPTGNGSGFTNLSPSAISNAIATGGTFYIDMLDVGALSGNFPSIRATNIFPAGLTNTTILGTDGTGKIVAATTPQMIVV